jgi:hypothetical protein
MSGALTLTEARVEVRERFRIARIEDIRRFVDVGMAFA